MFNPEQINDRSYFNKKDSDIIMAVSSGQEVEKTFIVKEMPQLKKEEIADIAKVIQDYILKDGSGELRIRKVTNKREGTKYDMAVKVGNGMIRSEVYKLLTQDEWKQLKLVSKATLIQTLIVPVSNEFVIHIYGGKLKGLVLVEVEFPSVKEANRFIPPYWFGKEVTNDIRFRGKSLAFSEGIPQ